MTLERMARRTGPRIRRGPRAGRLREAGVPIAVDEDLLLAFELEHECHELVHAATWLPDSMWAPLEGMRALLGGGR